jgi:hypothetical protein
MRVHEIENWALNVIEQTTAGQPNEDQRIELKADWIDPYKAARRIAGHANAARGVPILWLMGVDEKRGVTGAKMIDLASWYQQVESLFDGIAPDVISVNIPVGKKTVVALLFDTERAPFVLRVENTDRLEVPWRSGTRVRSARRDELLRLLSPLQKEPIIEVLGASAYVHETHTKKRPEPQLEWQLTLLLYIVPGDSNRLVLPYHSCNCTLSFPASQMEFKFANLWIEHAGVQSTLFITSSELVVDTPGMFLVRSMETFQSFGVTPHTDAHLKSTLRFVGSERPTVVETIIPTVAKKPREWESGQYRK